MNSDYISYSLPKNRKEIQLYLITLQKNPVGVWAVMTTSEAKRAHRTGRGWLWATALRPLALPSYSLAEQFVSIRRELKERTQMYLRVFVTNKAKISCLCRINGKLHPLKHEHNLFLPHSSVTNFSISSSLNFSQ